MQNILFCIIFVAYNTLRTRQTKRSIIRTRAGTWITTFLWYIDTVVCVNMSD